MTATIGVLALQGSFNEHIAALRRLGVKGLEVRKPEHLDNVGALIIPGGESTTMAKLAEYHNLVCTAVSFLLTLFIQSTAIIYSFNCLALPDTARADSCQYYSSCCQNGGTLVVSN